MNNWDFTRLMHFYYGYTNMGNSRGIGKPDFIKYKDPMDKGLFAIQQLRQHQTEDREVGLLTHKNVPLEPCDGR